MKKMISAIMETIVFKLGKIIDLNFANAEEEYIFNFKGTDRLHHNIGNVRKRNRTL